MAPTQTAPPPTRQRLLDAMRLLMLRKGLPGATVDEVCATAGVTKGSFYHFFASKDELAAAALQAYFDDIMAALAHGDWAQQAGPWPRLLGFLDQAAAVFSGPLLAHGCLMAGIALNMAEVSPAYQQDVSAKFALLREAALPLFDAVGPQLRPGVTPGGLTDQLIALIEGAVVLAKAHQAPQLAETTLTGFRQLVELLRQPGPAEPLGA